MEPKQSTQAESAAAALPLPQDSRPRPAALLGAPEPHRSETTPNASRIIVAAPLFPVAVGLIAGILLDRYAPISPAVCWIAFLLAPLALVPRTARHSVAPMVLALVAAAAGAILHLSVARTIPPGSIEHHVQQPGRLVRLYGTVRTDPRILRRSDDRFGAWSFHTDRTTFLIQCRSVEGLHGVLPVTGGLRVTVREAMPDLRAGRRVAIFGRIYPLRPPDNPGAFDWAGYSRRQGIFGALTTNHGGNVEQLEADATADPGVLDRARRTAHDLLTNDLAAEAIEEAGLLDAIILGQRSQIDRTLNASFVQAGCAHFLAVSGIHVVIVMALVRFLCWPFMLRPRTRTWIMLVAVVAFVLLAEPRPSILRAGTIAVLYCIACLLSRQRAHLNWLSAAAIMILLVRPTALFDVGWQLSFAAVLGVSYLTPGISGAVRSVSAAARRAVTAEVVQQEEIQRLIVEPAASPFRRLLHSVTRSMARSLTTALFVSIAAWLVVLPIILVHFHRIQAWAAINSFLLFLPVTVVMALGFAKLLLGALSTTLGQWVGSLLTFTDGKLIDLVRALGELPAANVVAKAPPWWVITAYYAFLLALAAWAAQRRRQIDSARRPPRTSDSAAAPRSARGHRLLWVGAVAFLAASAAWAWTGRNVPLRVTILNVGAGSATAIEFPNGQTWLYDVGSLTRPAAGRSVVVPYLEYRGIRRIDRVILSHANTDHYNGLLDVLGEVPAGPVVTNPYFEEHSGPRSASRFLLRVLGQRGQPIEHIDAGVQPVELGGVTVETLWPPAPTAMEADAGLAPNDASTVIRLTYAGRSILLTGDIEEQAERALIQRGGLSADVLILPHHGSVEPSSKEFIDAVDPQLVIRSSNEPMARTDNGLEYVVGNRPLYNTADDGAVTIRIDETGSGIAVATAIPRR